MQQRIFRQALDILNFNKGIGLDYPLVEDEDNSINTFQTF